MARRSGLGKGLEALIPNELAATGDESLLTELDIAYIVPNRHQPREHFDEESLQALADSISEVGLIQPIVVRQIKDGYEIVAGERRWRAAQRAGHHTIPALIRTTDDRGALEAAIIENVNRQDLNVLEEAAAYRQLMDDFRLTQEEVASRVGRSRSAIANTIRLLKLAPTVQRLVFEGHLSAGHGRALLMLEDEADQQNLAEEIQRDGLSVRDAEHRVANLNAALSQAELKDHEARLEAVDSQEDDPDQQVRAGILELEGLLSTRLETGVRVQLNKNNGKITIRFGGLADLERIYHAIMRSDDSTS